MPKTIAMVRLVCLASKGHQETLVGVVEQLSVTVSLVDSVYWLGGHVHDPNAPIILALPEDNTGLDQIVKAILATPLSPYLVISHSPLTDNISPILAVCDDYCRWPGDPFELAFRLRRLLSRHSPFPESDLLALQTAAWKNAAADGEGEALF